MVTDKDIIKQLSLIGKRRSCITGQAPNINPGYLPR